MTEMPLARATHRSLTFIVLNPERYPQEVWTWAVGELAGTDMNIIRRKSAAAYGRAQALRRRYGIPIDR